MNGAPRNSIIASPSTEWYLHWSWPWLGTTYAKIGDGATWGGANDFFGAPQPPQFGNAGLSYQLGHGNSGETVSYTVRAGRPCVQYYKVSGTGFDRNTWYLPWWMPAWTDESNPGAGSPLLSTVLVFDWYWLTSNNPLWDTKNAGIWFVPTWIDAVPTVFSESNLPTAATPVGGFGFRFIADPTATFITQQYVSYDQANILDSSYVPDGAMPDPQKWSHTRIQIIGAGGSRPYANLTASINGVPWIDQDFDGVKLLAPMDYTYCPNVNFTFGICSYFASGAASYLSFYNALEIRAGRVTTDGVPIQTE